MIPSSDRLYGRCRLAPAPTIRKVEGGFPHSEIPGSKLVRSSPRLIAAYHVLHRLSAPRHPPNALKALDRSRDRCPSLIRQPFRLAHQRDTVTKRPAVQSFPTKPPYACRTQPAQDRLSPPHRPHSLFTMFFRASSHAADRTGSHDPRHGTTAANASSRQLSAIPAARHPSSRRMVEPDGIEPTT